MKRIHILKAGTFTPTSGEPITLTKDDLVQLASGFDRARNQAPIVVGHPKLNAPAYGWTKSLEVDNEGNVFATPDQVNPEFAELVRKGSFKTVSASLFPPTHASNPTPGQWSLRHIGFLGAMPPAIKGLQEVELAGGDDGLVEIEFGEWDQVWALNATGRMFRRLRDFVIAKFGLDTADQVLSDWDVKSLENAAAVNEAETAKPQSFSEGGAADSQITPNPTESDVTKAATDLAEGQNKLKADQEALAARETAIAEKERQQAERERAAHVADLAGFVGDLVKQGRVLPANRAVVVELLSALDASKVVEFGEGDAKTSATHLDAFKNLLKTAPVIVPQGQLAKDGEQSLDLADSAAVAAAAQTYMAAEVAAGRTCNAAQAVAHVTASKA